MGSGKFVNATGQVKRVVCYTRNNNFDVDRFDVDCNCFG